MLDEEWIRSLHVRALRRAEAHRDRAPHALFQASTVAALLEGSFDGDLSFAELAEHGDLGLGTLNRLDGEMVALDGRFYRADAGGDIHPVGPAEKTPFAVVVRFRPRLEEEVSGPLDHAGLLRAVDSLLPDPSASCAIRIDGAFALVHARSLPAQSRPYRPIAEVMAEQHVFDLVDVEGTMVGFRFPSFAEGLEIGGYHLHFIDSERRRGGHVLDSVAAGVRLRLDPSNDLHIELPPGVDLADPDLSAATHDAVSRIEHDG